MAMVDGLAHMLSPAPDIPTFTWRAVPGRRARGEEEGTGEDVEEGARPPTGRRHSEHLSYYLLQYVAYCYAVLYQN